MRVDLRQYIDTRAMGAALVAMLPLLVAVWFWGGLWENALLLSISLLMGYRNFRSGPLVVLLQAAAIVGGIYLLTLAAPHVLAYVLVCTLMAVCVLVLAGVDLTLRAIGTWIFLPVVYLSMAGTHPNTSLLVVQQQLPYLLVGVLPMLLYSTVQHGFYWQSAGVWSHLPFPHHLGRPLARPGQVPVAMVAAFLSVGTTAWIVQSAAIPEAQWLIWSSLSVIGTERQQVVQKMQDRLIGSLVGVPLAVLLGLTVVPASHLSMQLMSVLILASFFVKSYRVAFAIRSASHALILTLLSVGVVQQYSRLIDVALGGVVAVLAFYLVSFIWSFLPGKTVGSNIADAAQGRER